MNKIVLTVAPSGSGKSFWCRKFLIDNPEYIYVSTDLMRFVLAGDESNQDKNHQVFQTLEYMVAYLMTINKPILLDSTCYNQKNRSIWNKLALIHNYEKIWVVFKTPFGQCVVNNEKRTRRVPVSVIEKQFAGLTLPLDEGGEIQYIDWVN